MRKRLLVKIALTAVFLAVFIVATYFGIQVYIDKYAQGFIVTAETAPVCDAIMVLGAFAQPNGKPSPVLEDRLKYALELYQAGKAKKILVSGDHGTKEYDEANVMKEYLLQQGVPREDIFMDHAGFNTYDSNL